MTVEEMQQNLDNLASILNCRLDQQPNMTGMMYVEFGYVEGPSLDEGSNGHYPNAQSRYLTCLHELGHFAHGHTQGRPMNDFYATKAYGYAVDPDYYTEDRNWYFNNGVLKSEAEAWNYALDQCKIPSDEIEPETRLFMWNTCLSSYFGNAQAVGFETPGQKLYNGDRAYTTFAYGKPNAYFFETKRRILEGDREKDETDLKYNDPNPFPVEVQYHEEMRYNNIDISQWRETLNSSTFTWTIDPMSGTTTN